MSVYMIMSADSGTVKIGTAADVPMRLRQLRTGSASELRTIRVLDGGQGVERWLHRRFAEHRIRGEWFTFVREMMDVRPPDIVEPLALQQPRFRSVADAMGNARALGLIKPAELSALREAFR